MWDYVTDFANYLMPMPNFDALDQNLRLFREMGVRGVLEQGNFSHGGGGHLAELQAYLQAKLLWNPDCDMEAHLQDFLRGYYGEAAAPYVREYIDLWQEAARPWHVNIGAMEDAPFVSDERIERSMGLLGEALFVTEGAEERKRLARLRLGMEYLLISRMPLSTPGRNALIARFGWEVREAGIDELHERRTLEETLDQMRVGQSFRDQRYDMRNDYKM